VAVYSTDAESLHVSLLMKQFVMDLQVTFLFKMSNIIAAAEITNADAISRIRVSF
jgi:hypothetical protein